MIFVRNFFLGVVCVLSVSAFSAYAADWPERPVRIIVPFGAGSADTAARLLADGLRQRSGKVVVVENRPGAGQNVGAGVLYRATADGSTLMVTAPGPLVINQFLYPRLEFDPHAFTPVTLLTTDPLVFVVNSKSPYKTLQSFIDEAKRNPGKRSYASAGAGATSHMMTAILFAMAAPASPAPEAATVSMITAASEIPKPAPPYSCGMAMPSHPASANAL